MAQASLTMAHPEHMRGAAGQTQQLHGELKSHLNGLMAAQQEFHGHLKGATGTALQNALTNAIQTGNDLANFLQHGIIDKLNRAGVQFDASDQEAKGMVAGAHMDGNTGEATSVGAATKVDVASWG